MKKNVPALVLSVALTLSLAACSENPSAGGTPSDGASPAVTTPAASPSAAPEAPAAEPLGGEVLGIPDGSPNKELAIKFIQYLESKDVQATLMRENGWASFRNDVYEEVEDWQKPYFEALTEALAAAQPLPNVPYWGKVQQAINDASKEILLDGADVKTTLDKYAAQIQTEIANYNA